MNFNTAYFLFLFLPLFLIIYTIAGRRWRVWVGLAGSLVFYAWGQVFHVPLILGLAVFNYLVGLQLGKQGETGTRRGAFLFAGVAINIGVLAFYKLIVTYGTGLFGGLTAVLPGTVESRLSELVFPLGLSYISFQAVSYLVDVSRGTTRPEKSLPAYALYIFLFPKLLTGPITRYAALAGQLALPKLDRNQVASGVRRFIQGFAKKVLIADILAKLVNAVFDQAQPNMLPGIAWLALLAFALQIYFDFSGYTDMAIGLGWMMGFSFMENFNDPYLAQSVGDFWRRWHISLSSWFRDYVYYPLERRRISFLGQPFNILVVFALTGLWHGVTLTFLLWGLVHGIFIVLESLFLGRLLQRSIRPVRHVYTLGVLLLTWLIFRSPSPAFAFGYLGRLMGNSAGINPQPFIQSSPLPFIEPSFWLALGIGIALSLPLKPLVEGWRETAEIRFPAAKAPLIVLSDLILFGAFVLAIGVMTTEKFLPGIYGRF